MLRPLHLHSFLLYLDDITHFNEDESISKPAANLSCGSDSILIKSDVQEELQGLQDGLGCVPATDVTTQAFPSTVVSLNQEKGSCCFLVTICYSLISDCCFIPCFLSSS